MKKNSNIVTRCVPPVTFLVDITKGYNSKKENLLEIDEVGLAIWNCIMDGGSRQEVINKFLLLLNDEKTPEFISMVSDDVNSFIDILVQSGCIEEDESDGV